MMPLVDLVGKIGGKLVDRFLPETMSEKEKKAAILEAENMARVFALSEEEGFRNFVLEYEGRAKNIPRSMQILRASVRPLLTYLLIGSTCWLVWSAREIPTSLFQLDLLCAGFWFGERAVTNYLKTKQGGEE